MIENNPMSTIKYKLDIVIYIVIKFKLPIYTIMDGGTKLVGKAMSISTPIRIILLKIETTLTTK